MTRRLAPFPRPFPLNNGRLPALSPDFLNISNWHFWHSPSKNVFLQIALIWFDFKTNFNYKKPSLVFISVYCFVLRALLCSLYDFLLPHICDFPKRGTPHPHWLPYRRMDPSPHLHLFKTSSPRRKTFSLVWQKICCADVCCISQGYFMYPPVCSHLGGCLFSVSSTSTS